MTRLLFPALVLFLCCTGTTVMGDPEFLAGIEDLPLMAELHEVKSATLVFDKPDGRIIEATAIGAVVIAQVQRFYHSTLPALGWARIGHLRFTRDGEVLSLSILQNGDLVQVFYSIVPDAK